jgi:hypothetical protein
MKICLPFIIGFLRSDYYYIIRNMTANFLNTNFVKSPFDMALGEELFEESGNITGVKVTRVHPIEGITMEVSFTSEIRGIGRFPSGKNLGSGLNDSISAWHT